jgi:hypothetical protein
MNKQIPLLGTALLLCLFLFAFSGCGNKGDDDDGGGGSPITFTPDDEGRNGYIWLKLESTKPSEGKFTLHVLGEGILHAYGVAGRLQFDTSMIRLDGGGAGPALDIDGSPILTAIKASDDGGIFGFTRSGDIANSVTLDSEKVIGILEFTALKPGKTAISFVETKSRVLDQNLKKVDVVKWMGGTIEVR